MTSLPTIRKRRKRWNLFFLALPLMLMVLAFRYAPLFGWYLSLVDYKVGQPIFKSRFVGLYFFKMLFTSRDMSRIMRNSIILSALKTVSLVLPPVFAILLNELNNSRFRKFAQTTTTLPHFVSWVIVYSIAYALFTSDGIVNQLLGLFGKSQKLLTNKTPYTDSRQVSGFGRTWAGNPSFMSPPLPVSIRGCMRRPRWTAQIAFRMCCTVPFRD